MAKSNDIPVISLTDEKVIEKLLAEAEARKGQNHPMPQEESDVDGIEGQQVRIAA